jgi:hypothetical protein
LDDSAGGDGIIDDFGRRIAHIRTQAHWVSR